MTAPLGRTLLVLGRVSNVPTVWSNCLAGWILGGGGDPGRLLLVCAGATLVYIGGMYLNDAFDAGWDRQYRRERPIPSGAIAASIVWAIGLALAVGGTLLLASLGTAVAYRAAALLAAVVVYDAVHKRVPFSPVLMGLCRLLLVLTAAAAARTGETPAARIAALALACYIIGLSYLARRESLPGVLRFWPLLFLGAPIAAAAFLHGARAPVVVVGLSLVVLLWIGRSLRFAFDHGPRDIGRSVAALLAGICLVDWLLVGPVPPSHGLLFVLFCAAALLFQRTVPAT
ncbi:MAG TPA: UbiA family prenyltransferase [Vicinamibacterales bacterium]